MNPIIFCRIKGKCYFSVAIDFWSVKNKAPLVVMPNEALIRNKHHQSIILSIHQSIINQVFIFKSILNILVSRPYHLVRVEDQNVHHSDR